MNPKLAKTIAEIERTQAKIAELSELLPKLETRRRGLEEEEILKVFRQVSVKPGDFADFMEKLRGQTGTKITKNKEELNETQAQYHSSAGNNGGADNSGDSVDN